MSDRDDLCAVHGEPWKTGRNMANAPMGRYCPWDGSMHPDEFMAYLEKPGTELTPTDKNYKVYISVVSDEPEQMREMCSMTRRPTEPRPEPQYGREWLAWDEAVERHPELAEERERHLRHVERTAPSHPWRTDTHWIQVGPRGDRREGKFYFEHLSEEQRRRFVEKLNAGELTLREPGFFYRLPFFMSKGGAAGG